MKTSLIKLPVLLFSALLLFGCQGAPLSQGASSAADEGMSEERLARIDSMLTEAIEKDPGRRGPCSQERQDRLPQGFWNGG